MMGGMIMEEISLGDMVTLLKIQRGQYLLVEERIAPGAKGIGVPIKDLPLPEHCVIAAIIRNEEVIVPRGVTTLEMGDEMLAVTDRAGAMQLEALFGLRGRSWSNKRCKLLEVGAGSTSLGMQRSDLLSLTCRLLPCNLQPETHRVQGQDAKSVSKTLNLYENRGNISACYD